MKYYTSGESHGAGLLALIEGFPSGLSIDKSLIDKELQRRQGGYGRGGRQSIETDKVEVLSGIRNNVTIGSPISLWIKNQDHKIDILPEVTYPRPGHADLAGAIKFRSEIRPILERASARETAARVAAGALARQILEMFGIRTVAYVVSLGSLSLGLPDLERFSVEDWINRRDSSVLYSLVPEKDEEAKKLIDETTENGDTLGGIIEVRATGLPIGLGTHTEWHNRLDGRLAQAVMSIQAIKGVEIGLGFESARRPGSQVHDPIGFQSNRNSEISHGFTRSSNHAGGIEGGMTNSEPLVLRAAMKPIATLKKPLLSVNMRTGEPFEASYERSDVCAVSAASVVVENVVAFELAAAFLKKYGCDSISEIRERFESGIALRG